MGSAFPPTTLGHYRSRALTAMAVWLCVVGCTAAPPQPSAAPSTAACVEVAGASTQAPRRPGARLASGHDAVDGLIWGESWRGVGDVTTNGLPDIGTIPIVEAGAAALQLGLTDGVPFDGVARRRGAPCRMARRRCQRSAASRGGSRSRGAHAYRLHSTTTTRKLGAERAARVRRRPRVRVVLLANRDRLTASVQPWAPPVKFQDARCSEGTA